MSALPIGGLTTRYVSSAFRRSGSFARRLVPPFSRCASSTVLLWHSARSQILGQSTYAAQRQGSSIAEERQALLHGHELSQLSELSEAPVSIAPVEEKATLVVAPSSDAQMLDGTARLLRRKSRPSSLGESGENGPATVADMHDIVAANTPIFYMHPDERFFPCTVEWFLERCRLCVMGRFRMRVLEEVLPFGAVTPEALKEVQPQLLHKRLQLQLREDARPGMHPSVLDEQVPVYAHVKEVVDPAGRREALEINYMHFAAFNGDYRLFDTLYVGQLGAHDADWEHITVRLSPDGQQVQGIYYSAHRHRDGQWRDGVHVPLTETKRPIVYVAKNGHGAYPKPGLIPRLYYVINDYCGYGVRWTPQTVALVTPPGKLPSVESRGDSLSGSSYKSGHLDSPAPAHGVRVQPQRAEWLDYHGKWGSTVTAPALQEWFCRAENPITRTWTQQVFLPWVPGVESIYEPVIEEVEEVVEEVYESVQHRMEEAGEEARAAEKEAAAGEAAEGAGVRKARATGRRYVASLWQGLGRLLSRMRRRQ